MNFEGAEYKLTFFRDPLFSMFLHHPSRLCCCLRFLDSVYAVAAVDIPLARSTWRRFKVHSVTTAHAHYYMHYFGGARPIAEKIGGAIAPLPPLFRRPCVTRQWLQKS